MVSCALVPKMASRLVVHARDRSENDAPGVVFLGPSFAMCNDVYSRRPSFSCPPSFPQFPTALVTLATIAQALAKELGAVIVILR